MPMRVSQLKGPTRSLSIEVPDENGNVGPEDKIEFTYRPGELTLEVSDRIKAAMSSGYEGDVAALVLEPVIKSWDLLDDSGAPLPCNAESLKTLPLPVLGLMMQGLYQDIMPDPQKSELSNGSSSTTDVQAGPPTGSLFSEQPIEPPADPGNS